MVCLAPIDLASTHRLKFKFSSFVTEMKRSAFFTPASLNDLMGVLDDDFIVSRSQ